MRQRQHEHLVRVGAFLRGVGGIRVVRLEHDTVGVVSKAHQKFLLLISEAAPARHIMAVMPGVTGDGCCAMAA